MISVSLTRFVGLKRWLSVRGFDVVRVILGSVLLIAAGLKGYQLATEPTLAKSIFTSRYFLMAEVEFELTLAVFLLSGLYKRCLWIVTLLCFAGFSCITLYKVFTGQASCGCFGKVEINPWYTFIFDMTAVGSLVLFRPQEHRPEFRFFPYKTFVLACIVLFFLVLLSVYTIVRYQPIAFAENGFVQEGGTVVLDPDGWIGKPFPLVKYIDIDCNLSAGKWIILLYHYDCTACQRTIPKYERLAYEFLKKQTSERVALVEMPPYGKACNVVSTSSPLITGKLKNTNDWFAATPLVFRLADSYITEITYE